jgi:hypothetical protein
MRRVTLGKRHKEEKRQGGEREEGEGEYGKEEK